MTCCWPSSSALKVWKNSSCERSLPAKNWMSSISRASSERYACLELVDGVVLQRAHHVADEPLRMHIGDARVRVARADQVADGLHQVRLAETDAAVDEQRVVGAARVLRDLHRRGAGELVALALDEVVEREVGDSVGRRTEAAAFARGAARLRQRGGMAGCTAPMPPYRSDGAATPTSSTSCGDRGGHQLVERARRSGRAVLVHPVDDVAIRREQPHVPPSSTACSGRIQVLKCCSGSSASSRRRQRFQSEVSTSASLRE